MKAFKVSNEGKNTILSVVCKDDQNVCDQISSFLLNLEKISKEFKNVEFEYTTPTQAINS